MWSSAKTGPTRVFVLFVEVMLSGDSMSVFRVHIAAEMSYLFACFFFFFCVDRYSSALEYEAGSVVFAYFKWLSSLLLLKLVKLNKVGNGSRMFWLPAHQHKMMACCVYANHRYVQICIHHVKIFCNTCHTTLMSGHAGRLPSLRPLLTAVFQHL